ncbi:hypothetical protein T481_13770 [Enterococcus faecalis PF3]|nr:hypothetical protein T481_13770 [Enterococcus faecalis PF3]
MASNQRIKIKEQQKNQKNDEKSCKLGNVLLQWYRTSLQKEAH